MKLFLGNLSYDLTKEDLYILFDGYGEIESLDYLNLKDSPNKNRGYSFITLADDVQARRAIDDLNGHSLNGRAIIVKPAKPKE